MTKSYVHDHFLGDLFNCIKDVRQLAGEEAYIEDPNGRPVGLFDRFVELFVVSDPCPVVFDRLISVPAAILGETSFSAHGYYTTSRRLTSGDEILTERILRSINS